MYNKLLDQLGGGGGIKHLKLNEVYIGSEQLIVVDF